MESGIYLLFIPFIILATVTSYIITYTEWVKHYPTKKEPRKIAFKAAIVAFIFFSVLAFIYIFFIADLK
jgi:hypothetical protein